MGKHEKELKHFRELFKEEYKPETAQGNIVLIDLGRKIEVLEEILAKNRDCEQCNGWGIVECEECGHDVECKHCDSTGLIEK